MVDLTSARRQAPEGKRSSISALIQDAIEGECGLKYRGNLRIGDEFSCPLDRLGMVLRPLPDENSAWHEQPCGYAYLGPDRKDRARLRFRLCVRVMPTQPEPSGALKPGEIP